MGEHGAEQERDREQERDGVHGSSPRTIEALLAVKGVGPATLRALSLICELLYGAPASTRDPARYSFAHGGKDGFPFPVDRTTYDQSIDVQRNALSRARIGSTDRLRALRRLAEHETVLPAVAPVARGG